MQIGQQFLVRTDSEAQFTGTLAQNAALTASIGAVPAGSTRTQPGAAVTGTLVPWDGYVDPSIGGGKTCAAIVRNISIISVQNLAWEVWLWATNLFNNVTAPPYYTDVPMGRHAFASGDGLQIAAGGPWYYYVDGLLIPYADLLALGQVNIMLINRSVTGKLGGDSGAITIQLGMEPTQGW